LQDVGDFRREVAQMRQREVAREEELEGTQERLKQMQAELTAVKAAARTNVAELERLRTITLPKQVLFSAPATSFLLQHTIHSAWSWWCWLHQGPAEGPSRLACSHAGNAILTAPASMFVNYLHSYNLVCHSAAFWSLR
jgi:hypothetical protein